MFEKTNEPRKQSDMLIDKHFSDQTSNQLPSSLRSKMKQQVTCLVTDEFLFLMGSVRYAYSTSRREYANETSLSLTICMYVCMFVCKTERERKRKKQYHVINTGKGSCILLNDRSACFLCFIGQLGSLVPSKWTIIPITLSKNKTKKGLGPSCSSFAHGPYYILKKICNIKTCS